MTKFKYVEDYMEALGGMSIKGILFKFTLTTHDEPIINSMASSYMPYTEKQARYALYLINNYTAQFAEFGIDLSPLDNPQYRHPLRPSVNCSRYAIIVENEIRLKFQYQEELIDQLRKEAKVSQGEIKFDLTERYYRIALTEYNVNFVCEFARINAISVDGNLQGWMAAIRECEKTQYSITLLPDGSITNCPASLAEYTHGKDLLTLCDLSGILAYSVDDSLIQRFNNPLIFSSYLKSSDQTTGIKTVVDYAKLVGRLPIFVYDYGDSIRNSLSEYFLPDEIATIDCRTPKTKVVLIDSPPSCTIPLLISTVGILYGTKETLFQQAEKVVFFCPDVYSLRGRKPVSF